ncbi:MAG: outer membrane protein assembly factor BamD [Thermodesulfobacteriaceae bacterium]|nr:outer membrane protein assembly factor BamD [Thermodesulfobacteriaceae bacterium]MCX8041602.1 outer membrane protein assembly factor BamD [Thermodesulfobacteriaceae bacterium]MDW8136796.1 outer membrane protein assembly factor BamD [Thermodesulfobacterium sp.]
MKFNFLKTFILIFLLIFSLSSCLKKPEWTGKIFEFKKESPKPKEPELSELLNKAEKSFRNGQFDFAYDYYQEIKNKYPGSLEAILASLRMADCKYWLGDYLEAISLYEEFEKFYPTNEAIPYVIFQIATSYYKLKLSYDRDQTYTKKAIENYERLLKNFPESPYNLEAQRRIHELRELLAKQELYIANFYYRLKYYRGAYQRLLYLIENYPETLSAQKAKTLLSIYYQKALLETKELREGTKKDFWGEEVP